MRAFPRGQILIAVLVLLAAAAAAGLALLGHVAFSARTAVVERARVGAAAAQRAAIGYALACLNTSDPSACGGAAGTDYMGEPNVAMVSGNADITVTAVADDRKRITITGRTVSAAGVIAEAATVDVALDVAPIGFAYGAQAGTRGITLANNARIEGNVYSNGDLTGGNGSRITGDVIVARGADATSGASSRVVTHEFTFGRSSPNTDIAQPFTLTTTGPVSAISLSLRKIGQPPNATIRLVEDGAGAPDDDGTLATASLPASAVSTTAAWVRIAFTSPRTLTAGTRYWLVVDAAARASDHWVVGLDPTTSGGLTSGDWRSGGWQSSGGAFAYEAWVGGVMTKLDSVAIDRNAHAARILNTTVGGSTWSTDLSRVTVGGIATSGTITSSTIGGNATAEQITSSTIGGSVWCEVITGSTVGGMRNCPVPVDPPTAPGAAAFPVTDAHIAAWIADAAAGGTTGSVHPADGTTVRLGPITIAGDLTLDNGQTLILTGTVHVTGRITVRNHAAIALDPDYGARSGILVSDGPIIVENNGALRGSGDAASSLAVVSRSPNASADDPAILLGNGADGAMLIAPLGAIRLRNVVTVTQLTADGVILDENATLRYRAGFLDTRFSSGPTVAWTVIPGTWRRSE